jgi:proteasome lid subunit RPN8/RPN11
MIRAVRIHSDAWNLIVQHVRSVYPLEGCGAMWGVKHNGEVRVQSAVALPNTHPGSRSRHYQIEPEPLLVADQQQRRRGLRLVGIFHSHPDADPYFSAKDLRDCCPWYLYLIVSVRAGEAGAVRCWKPDPSTGTATEVEILYCD